MGGGGGGSRGLMDAVQSRHGFPFIARLLLVAPDIKAISQRQINSGKVVRWLALQGGGEVGWSEQHHAAGRVLLQSWGMCRSPRPLCFGYPGRHACT